MQRVYVSDANIWIDFRNAGLLDELFRLPFKYCSTDFVLEELRDLAPNELIRRGLIVESLDGTTLPSLARLTQEHNNSSLADVSCYLLAKQSKRPLLTGDGRLRRQAHKDGLCVHGVLWLLDQLRAHQITEGPRLVTALESMLLAGARLPVVECESRLKEWQTCLQG